MQERTTLYKIQRNAGWFTRLNSLGYGK